MMRNLFCALALLAAVGPWRSWLLFYAALLVPTVAACWLRAELAVRWLGVAGGPVLLLGMFPWVLSPIFYLEREAAFQREHAAQRAEIEAEIEKLFVSRESILRARARRSYELLTVLGEQLAPRLGTVAERLTALAQAEGRLVVRLPYDGPNPAVRA